MSIPGLIFGLFLILAAFIWIGAPLFNRKKNSAGDDSDSLLQKQRERLLLIYERVLTNLRDLDEDHTTGKMQTADYESERESWMQRGIQVLKAMDHIDEEHPLANVADDAAIDEEIERAIAAYRAKAQS
ncbi:MAG: hypothetical protein ABI690_05435 [Chloroflexota bacterium]